MLNITSVAQYQELVTVAKAERKARTTNCCLFPEAIQRYIDFGRFYYETCEAGVVFYSDEGKYYEGYYYLNPNETFKLLPKDKPVCIQHLYVQGKKSDKVLHIEQNLARVGFVLEDQMFHIRGNPEEILSKIEPLVKTAKTVMAKKGYRLCAVREDMLEEVWDIQRNEPEIPYYQLPFTSKEETIQAAEEGLFQGIVDSENKLCAVRWAFIESNSVYGWAAVRNGYKDINGWGLVFAEQAMKYAIAHELKVSGWIDVKNIHSQKYHEKLGYKQTGRYVDRWILSKGENPQQ